MWPILQTADQHSVHFDFELAARTALVCSCMLLYALISCMKDFCSTHNTNFKAITYICTYNVTFVTPGMINEFDVNQDVSQTSTKTQVV